MSAIRRKREEKLEKGKQEKKRNQVKDVKTGFGAKSGRTWWTMENRSRD